MPVTRVHLKRRLLARRYHQAVLAHWSAILPLLVGAGLAMLSIAFALGAALLGEVILLAALPLLPSFRKGVDDRLARHEAATVRAGLLKRMSAHHRGELAQIEQLATEIRKRCGYREEGSLAAPDLAVDRWLELEKLLALYVQLAVAHRDIADSFRAQDRATLDVEIEEMKALASERRGPRSTRLERRSAILERRRETWRHAARESDLIVQELSTIVNLLRWMQEVCTVGSGGSVHAEFEEALAAWESNGATLREVSTLCRVDEQFVDPAILALGREEMARRMGASSQPCMFVGAAEPAQEAAEVDRVATRTLVPDPPPSGTREATSPACATTSVDPRRMRYVGRSA